MSSHFPMKTQLVGRQKEVLYLPANGHQVVLGTAGSGKTTLAIYRAMYLTDRGTDHHGSTLLVTFNRCLVAYLRGLVREFPRELTVENYHKFARGYLSFRGRMRARNICEPSEIKKLCSQALLSVRATGVSPPALSRPVELLVEKFRWLAQHGISTAKDYVQAERVGRAGARIIRTERPALFSVYEEYKRLRTNAGKDFDWEDIAQSVLEELQKDTSARRYQHIVIDEGQDLSPVMLRSLAAAVPPNGSLTFFGDMAQQIYGNRISWRSAGLTVLREWQFQENYRNTKQVAKLALAIASSPHFRDVPDLVEPRAPTADGPLPTLIGFSAADAELPFVAESAKKMSDNRTVAILFRDRRQEAALESLLSAVRPTRLHAELKTWPSGPGIFYGTYHSAKGLEFDTVFLPYLSVEQLPHPPDVETFGPEDAAARDARLLYVAVTRARSALVMSYSGRMTELLPTDDRLYQKRSR